jgi:diacylglycerol diphosphate phosphatase/phosphatidate phosphatase
MLPEIFFELRVPEFFCAFCVGLFSFLFGNFVPPFCRPFSWDDPSISREYRGSTFPSYALAIMSALPCVVFVAVCLHRGEKDARTRNECVTWVLSQCVAVALSMLLVDVSKLYAGRLRPDFIDRLRIAGINSTTPNIDYCSISDNLVRGGRLSFPSGHSGISFAAMMTFAFFLMGLFQPFNNASFPRFLLCVIPLVLSSIVAISRTRDNVHNFDDIVTGSLVGLMSSFVAVRLHFDVTGGDRFVPRACGDDSAASPRTLMSGSSGSNEVSLVSYQAPLTPREPEPPAEAKTRALI